MHVCSTMSVMRETCRAQAKFYDTQDTPPTLPWSAKGFHELPWLDLIGPNLVLVIRGGSRTKF